MGRFAFNGLKADRFYETEEEDFDAAVLNSRAVRDTLILADMLEGTDQETFEETKKMVARVSPFPKMNSRNPKHRRLAELGRECRLISEGLLMPIKDKSGVLRFPVNRAIQKRLAEIDQIVDSLIKSGEWRDEAKK